MYVYIYISSDDFELKQSMSTIHIHVDTNWIKNVDRTAQTTHPEPAQAESPLMPPFQRLPPPQPVMHNECMQN